MKTISHGKLKRKYEKKKQYLMHYQLLQQMAKGSGIMLRLNLFIYAGFYLIWREYPIFLATLDFTFTVLCLIFLFVIKPKMLRGEINAYYRRDYGNMKLSMFLIQFFIQGGLMRFPILALFYGLTFYLVRDNPLKVEQYTEVVLNIVFNPLVSLIAIGAFALALYLLFYHERYVSIREFSNSVVEIYSSYPYTEEGAVHEFIRRKDQELEMFDVSGVKYDGAWNTSSPSSDNEYQEYPEVTEHVSGETTVPYVKEEPTEIVRRKARR